MRHLLLLTAFVFAGCREAPTPTPLLARVHLTRLPASVVGPDSTGVDLSGADAIRVDDTTIAILDYPASHVVLLSRKGRLLRTVGRHGGGPGEFQNPRFLVPQPDGFAVFDDLKLALVTFDRLGTPGPEISLQQVTGPLQGILTNIRPVGEAWAFSVQEPPPLGPREALYVRAAGVTQLLAATPASPGLPVRLPCGLTLSPQLPVFWPTLRWTTAGSRLAYAATAADQVVIWDEEHRDSVSVRGPRAARPATKAAALQRSLGVQVSTGRSGCAIDAAEVLRQRGMAPEIPVIAHLWLHRDGTLWVELDESGLAHHLRVHRPGGLLDTLTLTAPPLLFLSDSVLVSLDNTEGLATWGVSLRQ